MMYVEMNQVGVPSGFIFFKPAGLFTDGNLVENGFYIARLLRMHLISVVSGAIAVSLIFIFISLLAKASWLHIFPFYLSVPGISPNQVLIPEIYANNNHLMD